MKITSNTYTFFQICAILFYIWADRMILKSDKLEGGVFTFQYIHLPENNCFQFEWNRL